MYETWNELMLVIQKKTTDTPQTLKAKSEPFYDYLGPDVLESMVRASLCAHRPATSAFCVLLEPRPTYDRVGCKPLLA